MTPITPLHIAPAGTPVWNAIRLASTIAVLTSVPWAWMLNHERELFQRLLTEATMSRSGVERMELKYANGARLTVLVKEQTE